MTLDDAPTCPHCNAAPMELRPGFGAREAARRPAVIVARQHEYAERAEPGAPRHWRCSNCQHTTGAPPVPPREPPPCRSRRR